MTIPELREVAYRTESWITPEWHHYDDFASLVADAKALPGTREGFVIRFEDGTRLKIKGDAYCRIHASISRCTPLAIWTAMAAGDDLETMRRDLPEEFLADFDGIRGALEAQVLAVGERVAQVANGVAHLTDKEVGMTLDQIPADVRPLLFPYRKAGGFLVGRAMETVYRGIRPTGNRLPGYRASSSLERATGEAA